ncbi:hypothetical protein FPV67DRAFT_1453310 [Lyophyllum atratum]|nr:hypothetical protein FPV67DRAFT_1453310 [Lyophyllum atratum]
MATIHPKIVIDDTFGASFIGVLFTAMLYGITNLQTYFFYVYYPNDRIENKLLVSNYANPSALAIGHWSLFTSVAMNVLSAFLPSESTDSLLVLAHFCFGVETVVFLFIKKRFDKLPEFTLFAAMPFALFAVLADIFIAAALCILLYGSRTGFRRFLAVAEVIVFALSPHSLWFLAIDFVIGKLYANSLLATLNSRQSLRTGTSVNSVHMSDINFEEESRKTDNTPQKGVVLNLRTQDSATSGSNATRSSTSDSKVISLTYTLRLQSETRFRISLHQTTF